MSNKSFKGGVHPPERKDVTKDLAIEFLFPSTRMVWIPISQGGAPNSSLVKVGDIVARGQIIADSDSFMGVPVHASVAGTVKKIETHLATGNIDVPCIVIEADGSDLIDFMPPLDPFKTAKGEALARVRSAGLVGMGGAAFPTHVKLNPPKGSLIDFIIANGAECEPYLTIDARTMYEDAEKVVDGVAIAMSITGASAGIIALEDNKKELVPVLENAITLVKKNTATSSFTISVVLCKTKYPQGGEKMLIKAVTGREVPSGGLPAAAGCVVQNVGTLKALSEAFREGKPLIDRGLTISGGACTKPKNISVPIGTRVGDLIPEAITFDESIKKILCGGPMMGIAMKSASFPIQKNTSGVLFLTERETVLVEESSCIGCGRCMQACSCLLSPVLMLRAIKGGKLEDAKRYGLMDCIECGTCAYVCPARIKLVQHFRIGKQMVRAETAKQAARTAVKGAQ